MQPAVSPSRAVVTFCQELDSILGGGIRLGEVTEVCGPAGAGKTTLLLQLCLDAQIPEDMGGCEGEAIFVDTEGSVCPARLAEMATAVHTHLMRVLGKRDASYLASRPRLAQAVKEGCTPTALLSRIHIFRATDLEEQQAVLAHLRNYVLARGGGEAASKQPHHHNIRVIAIDSIALHHRYGPWATQENRLRLRALASLATQLNVLARDTGAAVVVANQLTTRLGQQGVESGGGAGGAAAVAAAVAAGGMLGTSTSRLLPALGDAWAHTAATRLHLRWDTRPNVPQAGQRVAFLSKSVCLRTGGGSGGAAIPTASAHFAITSEGVRGLRAVKAAAKAASGGTSRATVGEGAPSRR